MSLSSRRHIWFRIRSLQPSWGIAVMCLAGACIGCVGSAGGARSPAGDGGTGANQGGTGGRGTSGTGGIPGTDGAAIDAGPFGTGGGTTGGGGTGGRPPDAGGLGGGSVVACAFDITAAILANQDVTLAGDSCVDLPAATTEYNGVISGAGTLRLRAPSGSGALVLTADSTFTLPAARQIETATETKSPTDPNHIHYLVIQMPNPPAVFIDAGATLQLGTPTSTTGTIGNYIPVATTPGTMINLDNIEVNGTLVLMSGPTHHLGILSGTGVILRPPVGSAGGTMFLVGDNPFSGVYSQLFGGYFGSDHVIFSLPFATIFSNESFIVAAPEGQFGATAGHLLAFSQTIWESHYGDDINTDSGHIVFSGVYSYSNSGNQVRPALSDPRLNTMVVQNVAGSLTGGGNSSFRGINIEGGTTEWGDGTTSAFFLPSTPAPAAPLSTAKNAYINLHNGATLVFNYNGRYTCNVGITGGGGGPRADGSVGVGNLTIAPTPGNTAVLTMPQNYNGITTIGAGATLQLGNGSQVQAMNATVAAPTAAEPFGAVTVTTVAATYSGDSSLLTAESPTGAATDAIANDGHLIVNNTSTAITLSHITGAGTLTQVGPAAVTVLANNYRGGTDIRGGVLYAGDERALGSGNVANDAVLANTGRQGIISVGGNYRQSSNATVRLTVAARGSSPSLQVAGIADLDGTLEVFADSQALVSLGRRFVLVKAARGLRGRFRSVVAEGLDIVVHYSRTTCTAKVVGRRPAALVSRVRRSVVSAQRSESRPRDPPRSRNGVGSWSSRVTINRVRAKTSDVVPRAALWEAGRQDMNPAIDRELAAMIDHTLLRPDAVAGEIDKLCEEARAFGFRTVCVQPVFVSRAARNLSGSVVGVTAVVAFPHGATTTDAKLFETERAIADGATEIDMVANLGWIRAGDDGAVTDEVARIVAAAVGAPVKVILETSLFSGERKAAAARAAIAGRAAFVKTSTGYGPGGATVEDVALLRRIAGNDAGVKASGGIKTREQALALIAAGAKRIGASGSIALVDVSG